LNPAKKNISGGWMKNSSVKKKPQPGARVFFRAAAVSAAGDGFKTTRLEPQNQVFIGRWLADELF